MSTEKKESVSEQIQKHVKKKINFYCESDRPSAKAELAKLRRGIGKEPGDLPELWGEVFFNIPESLKGYGEKPSRAEAAIYHSLTLFALHQQSLDASVNSMQQPGISPATAVGLLLRKKTERNQNDIESETKRLQKKIEYTVKAESVEDFVRRLRPIVQLLKAEGIGFDYGKLAEMLFFYSWPEKRKGIRLQWGRDFYTQVNMLMDEQRKEEEKNNEE